MLLLLLLPRYETSEDIDKVRKQQRRLRALQEGDKEPAPSGTLSSAKIPLLEAGGEEGDDGT